MGQATVRRVELCPRMNPLPWACTAGTYAFCISSPHPTSVTSHFRTTALFDHPAAPLRLTRRSAFLGAAGMLALPALSRAQTRQPAVAVPPSGVWPQTLRVPGGVARLPLGPATSRPLAHVLQGGVDVPLLVVGNATAWTALVGIPLAATPGEMFITVATAQAGATPRTVS